jgi:hypothetical protein
MKHSRCKTRKDLASRCGFELVKHSQRPEADPGQPTGCFITRHGARINQAGSVVVIRADGLAHPAQEPEAVLAETPPTAGTFSRASEPGLRAMVPAKSIQSWILEKR